MENNTMNKKKTSTKPANKSVSTKKVNNNTKKKNTTKSNPKKTTGNPKTIKETKKQTNSSTKVRETETIKIKENKKVEVAVKEEKKAETPKEVKQVKNDIDNYDFGSGEIKKLLVIIGVVCAVMLAFYFITEVVLKKKDKEVVNEPSTIVEPTIQYEEIVMGSLLKQKETDYYVLVYNEDDTMLSVYNQYIDLYKKTNEPLKLYRVNLNSSFNKSFIADESYLSGTDINQIKVKGTTLIRVSNGSVYKFFEGSNDIVARFKYMLELN